MWRRALLDGAEGAPVPLPWGLGVTPARGQLVVCLGAPGIGKSAFSLNWALALKEPVTIVSLDTDLRTQAQRSASIMAGASRETVARWPGPWATYLERRLRNVRIFDLPLTPNQLTDLVEAEKQWWGSSPALVVVDNLTNLVKEINYEQVRKTVIDLKRLAHKFNTCVLALHHVGREWATRPLALHAGQYAGEHEAEVVLGLWGTDDDSGELRAGVLKNRHGPSGYSRPLVFERTTLRIRDRSEAEEALTILSGGV